MYIYNNNKGYEGEFITFFFALTSDVYVAFKITPLLYIPFLCLVFYLILFNFTSNTNPFE